MSIPPILSYPSDEDIGYAVWLKNFAIRLPDYANRYDLSMLQVLQVQCAAGEFIELLIHRMQCTTIGIRLRQFNATPIERQNFIAKMASLAEHDQHLRSLVAEVVAHVQLHPARTDYDSLDLAAKPLPPAGSQ